MTLGLCMIVKNESEVLARALESIKSAVDEIVIVDTGSTDNTVEIARRYTDKVYSYVWRNDFSAARNYAVSKVTSDYWMWLDADDVVPERTARLIGKLIRGADGQVDVYMLPYVLGTDNGGKPTFSYYRERIMKNRADFLFVGRVHEAVVPHGNVVREPFPILHAKPHERTSGTRNLDIYKAMVAEGEPLGPREKYYYSRELYFNGLYDEAARELKTFLKEKSAFTANKIDACILLSRCHRRAGDTEAALGYAFNSFVYGLPTGEACCEIGSIYFDKSDYKSAAYWYERAARLKPDLDSGAFIDANCYGFIPLIWLAVCYDRLGDTKKAYRYHKRARRLCPEHPSVIQNQKYFESLGYS